MTKEELNLLQFATIHMAELGARSAKIVWCEMVYSFESRGKLTEIRKLAKNSKIWTGNIYEHPKNQKLLTNSGRASDHSPSPLCAWVRGRNCAAAANAEQRRTGRRKGSAELEQCSAVTYKRKRLEAPTGCFEQRKARPLGPGSRSLTRAVSAQTVEGSCPPRRIALRCRAGNL